MSECICAADSVVHFLDQFEQQVKSSRWKSIHKALQAVWNEEKMDALTRQLESLQGKLALQVMVTLNSNVGLQTTAFQEYFRHLDRQNQEVVKVMSINQSTLSSTAHRSHGHDDQTATVHRDQPVAAFLTTGDGEIKYLTRGRDYAALSEKPTRDHSDARYITFRGGSGLSDENIGVVEIETKKPTSVHKKVLNSLYFRQIAERIDDVSPRWQKNFRVGLPGIRS